MSEHVSEAYREQLEDLAHTLVTPERFGGRIAVKNVTEEESFDWEPVIVRVNGNAYYRHMFHEVYAILGEEE